MGTGRSPWCGCTAWIRPGDERAYIWTKLRGTPSWPVFDPIGDSDGTGQRVFRGRLSDLDDEQLQTLLIWIARFRNRNVGDVTRDLADLGYYPILASSCTVTFCPGHSERLIDSAMRRTSSPPVRGILHRLEVR